MKRRSRGLARSIAIGTLLSVLTFSAMIIATNVYINFKLEAVRQQIDFRLEQHNRIQDAEGRFRSVVSGVRAYVAYGRVEFWVQAHEDRHRFRQELEELLAEHAGRPSDTARLKATLDLFGTYERHIEEAGELKEQGDTERLNTLSITSMTPIIEEIQQSFDELVRLQRQQIAELLRQDKFYSSLPLYLSVAILAGAVAIASFLMRFMRVSVVAPIQEMESVVHDIGQGRYVTIDTLGRKDEIGSLQAGINAMILELRKRYDALQDNMHRMAEQHDELEAQHEEMTAQQREQQETLEKLIERERQLRLINSFQSQLTGKTRLSEFTEHAVSSLLHALGLDAAAIVMSETAAADDYRVLFASGYPGLRAERAVGELFGPAYLAVAERRTIVRERALSAAERGVHAGYETAEDAYFPLVSDELGAKGVLLLTSYGSRRQALHDAVTEGLVCQFAVAFFAQWAHEERRKESERVREQKELVQRIVETIHEGVLLCDRQGRIMYANRRARDDIGAALSGDTVEAVMERLAEETEEFPADLSERVRKLLRGRIEELSEKFSVVNGGERHYFDLYASAVRDQELENPFLFVFRNRTEEERSNQLKDEFISIVSHEFRTPLASVLGYMEILLQRELPAPRQRQYMETIYKESTRLSALINDFLDLQRMEAGKQTYRLVPLPLAPLLEEIAEQWRGRNGHDVRLDAPEDGFVLADRDRLTQVMHNLLSNAVKYSPNADRVDVRLRREASRWTIEVQDYGLGIPEEARPQMFSKFYRVDNSDRRQIGGTGLGLAIVKEIVDEHGGAVTYDSTLGEGTTFRLSLPAYDPPSIGGKIVVVEDDDNLCHMIADSFEQWALETECVATAEEAMFLLQRSREHPPALAIVDIQLKGMMTGWDVVTALREDEALRRTPLLVVSVMEKPDAFQEAPNGIFLRKPFTVERLLEAARGVMTAAGADAEGGSGRT